MSKTDTTAKSKNSMATFFKVLRFIGKYRFLLVLCVILAAVTVILQLYVPVLFLYDFTSLSGGKCFPHFFVRGIFTSPA